MGGVGSNGKLGNNFPKRWNKMFVEKFPVESGRGAECPYCQNDDFNSRGVDIIVRGTWLIAVETCSSCDKSWEEHIAVFSVVPKIRMSQKFWDFFSGCRKLFSINS